MMQEQEVRKERKQKRIDLTELKQIPIIKRHLSIFARTPAAQKKYRLYLLTLRKIYNKIQEKYGSFESFLEVEENEKSIFLMEWVNERYEAKKTENPNGDFIAFKNTGLRNVWLINGFLGKLGRKYTANTKLLESQTPSSNLVLQANLADVMKLHDVLSLKYKLILKIMLFTGMNPVDILNFTLADFKSHDDGNYFYVYKLRQKTKSKGVMFLNVFRRDFFNEIMRYAHAQRRGMNDRIFPISPKTLENTFQYHIKKHNLNPKTMPRYIRQLNATLLEDVLPSKYLLLWTQHKGDIMTRHYLKRNIAKFIQFYPLIINAVELQKLG